MFSRWKIFLITSLSTLGLTPAIAAYPDKPVRIIAGASGTGADVISRILGPRLSEQWGQPVVVENRAGASGTIAATAVAKSAPDGYTLLMGDLTQLATAPKLYSSIPYHPIKDFAPVTLVFTGPMVVTAHPAFPATTLLDLIDYARQRPGMVRYASASTGTPAHLTSALLGTVAGINIVHVPYKGGIAALVAVMSQEVQFASSNALVVAPYIKNGRLKAFAVLAKNRTPVLPELPTSAEAGVPGLESTAWFGVVVPARASSQVVGILNRSIVDATRAPATRSALLALGGEPATGTPEAFGEWIRSETVKWEKVIKAIGAKAG
jgi:tripartite-type tricarboxylate transporter receptor subunit TctC